MNRQRIEGGAGINYDLLLACREATRDVDSRYPAQAVVAPTLLTSTSAFSPFANEEDGDIVQSQLAGWVETMDSIFRNHRSPFVASEVILERLKALGHISSDGTVAATPSIFSVTAALTILTRCAPRLGHAGGLLEEMVRQLGWYLWIPCEAGDDESICAPGRSGARAIERETYFDVYFRVRDIYGREVSKSPMLNLRASGADRVVQRYVHTWDKFWVRICFAGWLNLHKRIRAKRQWFARWRSELPNFTYLPPVLRAWRRHARRKMISVRCDVNAFLSAELSNLVAQEAALRVRHQKLSETMQKQLRQRNQLLEEVKHLRARTGTSGRLLETYTSIAAAQKSQWDHVSSLLTGDFRQLATDELHSEVADDPSKRRANITDDTDTFVRRAGKMCPRLDVSVVVRLVDRLGMAADARSSGRIDVGLALQRRLGQLLSDLSETTKGVPIPLTLSDLDRRDKRKLRYIASWLLSLMAGGYCSMFVPVSLPTSGIVQDRRNGGAPPKHQDGPVKRSKVVAVTAPTSGMPLASFDEIETMVADRVAKGLIEFEAAESANGRTLLALHDWITAEQLPQKQQHASDVRRLYELLKYAFGGNFQRAPLENAVFHAVSDQERHIVRALYPAGGISNYNDFATYVSNIAELLSISIRKVSDYLHRHVDLQPIHYIRMELGDVRVLAALRDQATGLAELFHFLANGTNQLQRERVSVVIRDSFHCRESDALELFMAAESNNLLNAAEFPVFVAVGATFADPSPLATLDEKIITFLRHCRSSASRMLPHS